MTEPRLRVLLVAEDGADLPAATSIPPLETVACREASPALTAGADEQFDALLLDATLAAPDVVRRIVSANPRLPIVVVVRNELHEPLALDALQCGADDYLAAAPLTAVAVCSAIRNARRIRQLSAERDAARHQLSCLDRQGYGVPPHFAEQLRISAAQMTAMADAVAEEFACDTPAARISRSLADDAARLLRLAEDLVDARRLASHSIILHRQPIALGELAEGVCDWTDGRPARDEAWDATVICDRDKTVRAIGQLVAALQETAPDIELRLIAERDGRIGVRPAGGLLPSAALPALLDASPVAVGEAGFQRCAALGLLADQQIRVHADTDTLWFDLPATPQQLTQRWADWLCENDGAPAVTLLEVETPDGLDADSADVYLHHAVTARDLVIRRTPRRWMIALSADGAEAEWRLRQLRQLWSVMTDGAPFEQRPLGGFELPRQLPLLEQRIRILLEAGRQRILVLDGRHAASPISRRLAEAGYDVVAVDGAQRLGEAPEADAIVGDAELVGLQDLPAHVPVFLLAALQDQQRRLQQNVRLIRAEDDQRQYDELIDALASARPRPAPACS